MTKVIKRFRDKNTKEIYKKGEVYKGDIKRVAELQKLGYLEKTEDEGLELEVMLDVAKSHNDLDKIVEELGLNEVPSKDDGATMDERKKVILEAVEKLTEKESE